MRTLFCVVMIGVVLGGTCSADDADLVGKPVKVEDILNTAQLAHIARRRTEITVPAGSAYRFTFENGPDYERVEVYYLIDERRLRGRTVRDLERRPSAIVYVVTVPWNWQVKKHLTEKQMAVVLQRMLAVKKIEGHERMVRIRRALFDIGTGTPGAFLQDRKSYYSSEHGRPLFDKWPRPWRTPSGGFTVSIVQTSVVHVPTGFRGVPVVEAKQFFGYTFPVLDELLTEEQKAKLADDVRRLNVRQGSAAVPVREVKDFGNVKVHYLVRDGKPLGRPTAMESTVLLTAKQIQDDPLVLRKYLATEGAAYLKKRIHLGERLGKKLKAVELVRMHFDVVTRGTGGAEAARKEFKKDLQNYCRRDRLLKPETWRDKFRQPDGRFDVELASTRIFWLVRKGQ